MRLKLLLPAIALLLAASPARALRDPCLRCDVMYASDCNFGLWVIDTSTGTSSLLATMPAVLFDIAVTSDGRLIGASGDGELLEISTCDGSTTVLAGSAGNALGSDLASTDLFPQGPPLSRLASDGSGTVTPIGGAIGPTIPDWCGTTSGDFAMSPADFRLRAALECGCGGGDGTSLQVIDATTGASWTEPRCITTAGGQAFPSVYGLAYDSTGTLWGVQAIRDSPLLRIDDFLGIAQAQPIAGGFDCGFGLACLPCGAFVDPCTQQQPPPADVGAALRVTDHGDPWAADITARLSWDLDEGAPRPADVHFHVEVSTDPRTLTIDTDPEPLRATSWVHSSPTAAPGRLVHFYRIRAADPCERESAD